MFNYQKYLTSTFFLISFLICKLNYAQEDNYNFTNLTVEDGLSQSTVFCILQDYEGYMWFGTTDGLNKYDGYTFTVYNNDPLDTNSISGNSITTIFEDSDKNLWVGTNEGILNKYDRTTDSFSHQQVHIRTKGLAVLDNSYYEYPLVFSRNNNQTITSIIEDFDKTLWIGTWGNGLIHFNKETGLSNHYFNNPEDSLSLSSNRVTDIVQDSKGNIWVSTFGGGLNRVIPSKDSLNRSNIKFLRFQNNVIDTSSLSDDKIISLFADNSDNIWIGSFTKGLNKIQSSEASKDDLNFISYVNSPTDFASVAGNMVTSITQDSNGDIWVGTFGGGVSRYDKNSNSFTSLRNNPFNENSLADNDILSLYSDNSGILWIGTHLGRGISKLTRQSTKFGLIQKNPNTPQSLNDEVIWAIHEDENSFLWIGTYRGGLNVYDRVRDQYFAFTKDANDPNSISDNHVRSIAEDYNNNLWIGTYSGGLNWLNKTTKEIRRIQFVNSEANTSTMQIQSIHIDENICWLGTFGYGLCFFNLEDFYSNKPLTLTLLRTDDSDPKSLSDNRVYSIYSNDERYLYVGTYGGGLNIYDKVNNEFTSFKTSRLNDYSISDNEVLTIFKDSEANYWIGTNGGGLNKFDNNTKTFEKYGESKGFKSQVIYGILEDNEKNLWMSSDNGILKYSLSHQNVIYYDLRDGLQSMEFSGGAYFKNNSGELFFGGISGINYFTPRSIESNDHIPPIVITEFKIFNEIIKGKKDEIKVSYDQNFFTIEYSALDYTDPSTNQYAHYMEGLETEWNYTNALLRKAFYTNLAPGSYIFHAKGSNSDGVWNNEGISLKVEILPPFWKTWWFILISILLIGALVSFLISMKVKHLLAMEKLKVRLAADLHDNVGAGLTEISILSELTAHEVKNTSEGAANKLNNISDTARQLVDSMSDIVWFVNPKRDSLHDLIVRLKDSYSDLLSELGVSFRTNNIESIKNVKIPMDIRQNLFLIFKEGINNSIKHSNCKRINLEANLDGTSLSMTLHDDGSGIPSDINNSGNGLRNMKERAITLGGELQINSSSNGTTIKFMGRLEKPNMFNFLWS
jgi:ligand-binding sensor domain-containing protein/two-component sensor histidine kinase